MMQTAANLDFRYPTVEDAAWAAPLLRTAGRMGCEYSFSTMFMWRSLYHNRLARWGDTLFISAGEESPVYLPPIGPSLADGVRVLLERSAGQERPLTLVGADATVVERLEDAFPGRFYLSEGRFRLYLPHEGSGGAAGERLSRQTQPHRWFFPEIQLDL